MNTHNLSSWLTVRDGNKALAFYEKAFGAVQVYRLEVPDTVVARLSINGAEFWIGEEAEGGETPENVGGGTVRMILTVSDPDAFFARAIAAGATEIFPVGEAHGWRLGRLVDPFGLHWEIAKPFPNSESHK